MDKKVLVLKALKTKVSKFGFSREELKGVAASIADKLDLDENASEEDINNAISDAIDDAMPFLELSQRAASRQVEAYRAAHHVEESTAEESTEESEVEPAGKKKPKGKSEEEEPAWAKALRERLDKQDKMFAQMSSEKQSTSRRKRLEEILKDTDKFGERHLKAFDRMSFKDDEDFENYLDSVTEDLEAYKQERANDGLKPLGKPQVVTEEGGDKKPKEMTKEEQKELADLY